MTKIITTNRQCYFFALFSLSIWGCSNAPNDAPETIEVTGTVTLQGENIKNGSIGFIPADGIGGSSGGKIVDGKFKFQSQFGEKQVIISAERKTGKKDEYGKDEFGSYIPERYSNSSKSGFRATVDDSQENKFTFDLKSE